MCMIIIIPNCSKIKDMDVFSSFMAELLQTQRDGFGYAAQGKNGVFGVRTLKPDVYARGIPKFVESSAVPFGEQSAIVGGAMFHGRISTNQRTLLNTHPIERNNWYIIHNGVVTDHDEKYKMNTTNDSEHVLKHLQNGGIDSVAKHLTGYYAAGVFDDKGLLHIFRDKIANLYYTYCDKLESPIFATTEYILTQIGKEVGEIFDIFKVKDDQYLVYDKGVLLSQASFKSRGYDYHSQSLSHLSLGRKLDGDNNNTTKSENSATYTGYYDYEDEDSDYWNYWNRKLPDSKHTATKLVENNTTVNAATEIMEQDEQNNPAVFEVSLDDLDEEWVFEVEYLDNSYIICLGSDNVLLEDFRKFSLIDQVSCEIMRSDGTFLVPFKNKN